MQGQGSNVGSVCETVNISQGSLPNNAGMNQQDSVNNVLNSAETQLSNYPVSSGALHGNAITHDSQSFSGWNSAEPSSRLNAQYQVNDDGMKIEHGWSSSYSSRAGAGSRLEESPSEPNSIGFPSRIHDGRSAHQVRNGPRYFQGSSSSHIPPNLNLNERHIGASSNEGLGIHNDGGSDLCNSLDLEGELIYNANTASDNIGSSSGSSNRSLEENNNNSTSVGSWGLSCKRKALEGTSGQSYSGGGTSSFQQSENSASNDVTACNEASSSLSLSTPLLNAPSVSPSDQPYTRFGVSMRLVTDPLPSSSVRRINHGNQQEHVPFSFPSAVPGRHSSFNSSDQPVRHAPFCDFLDLRSTSATANSSSSHNPPHAMHISHGLRNVRTFSWNNTSSSRAGSISSSLNGGGGTAVSREESSIRSIPRNNTENRRFVPATEVRNVAQDPAGWSLASGNISASGSVPSTTRTGHSTRIRHLPSPAWIPPLNPSTHNQQRLTEFSPWSLFPSADSESGGHNGHLSPLGSGLASSSQETEVPSGSLSRSNNQPYPASALSLERQGDDVFGMPHSLRALAADIEGRHRLISEIRQVLNAMRRGENLRVEDYMVFDPFVFNGMAEMHDRHRDMRLDVDNMSYEELLALEEQIGDVSTGLSEETIYKLMKQHKYMSTALESQQDVEPCCICQEEYVDVDDLGILDCGHEFHSNCIKQWLMQKNLCPICKTTALLEDKRRT